MSNLSESGVFEEVIRARAYALWESEGRPNGRDAEHWLRSLEEVQHLATKPIADVAKKAPKKPRGTKATKKN